MKNEGDNDVGRAAAVPERNAGNFGQQLNDNHVRPQAQSGGKGGGKGGEPAEDANNGLQLGDPRLLGSEQPAAVSVTSSSVMNVYIGRMTFSAGLGGLLFGYDTGVISGALLYIRDDFSVVDRNVSLQGAIVSTAIAGAIVGALVGGKLSDRFGRKAALLAADVVFVIGAIVMAASINPAMIIVGRIIVGIGIGVASMTAPLYIAESAPTKVRGGLVSFNGVLITGGQFVAYLLNLAFSKAPGTWRWMLGTATLPAIVQIVVMSFLSESPRWLYRQGKVRAAEEVLKKIYPPEQLADEVRHLQRAVDNEERERSTNQKFMTKEICLALVAGVGLQVTQQLAGINTVMYFAPSIMEQAGYASHQTALLLSLVTSCMNFVGAIVGMVCIDRFGRRRLAMCSLTGVIVALILLTVAFRLTNNDSPNLQFEPSFSNSTCPAYSNLSTSLVGSHCVQCLKAHPTCGFCAAPGDQHSPGVCLVSNKTVRNSCTDQSRSWFTHGCPSSYGWFALLGLALYIAAFSPGMGPVPWVVNSEIYPLKFRGKCGGYAAMGNWVSNLVVAQSFLPMTLAIGTSSTFATFGCFSVAGLLFVFLFVPETKGFSFEQVGRIWQQRAAGGWRSALGPHRDPDLRPHRDPDLHPSLELESQKA